MTDLIVFLRARLDEDEAKVAAMQREQVRVKTAPIFQGMWLGWLDGVDIFVSPKRWQAEVDAKRRLLAVHTFERKPGAHDCPGEWAGYSDDPDEPCPTLRLLALPYADHPDYREEWRP
jgi:hypothetical protein